MGKFLSDFKEFAMRGNVIDMAVGVIIGGAFGKIVSSLVDDMIMPVVGVLTGGMDFKDLKYVIKEGEAATAAGEAAKEAVTINYGMFIQNIVDFLIIAFCIFLAIRLMQKFHRQEAAKPAEPEKPAPDVELLTEIRDLLKEQNKK